MTHFRFRYKRVGYIRWRHRTAGRRRVTVLPAAPVQRASHAAMQRRTMTVLVRLSPVAKVLKYGDYFIGEEGDPQLLGHPDIRY